MPRGPVKVESRIDSGVMTPRALERLHERACFSRAYPRHPAELAAAVRILSGFPRRPDLRRHAEALADTGIAGTPIHYRFFWPMARWLANRYPALLTIDWAEAEFAERLAAVLPLLVTPAEAEALRRADLPAREAIDKLRAARGTDAAFVIARIEALPGGDHIREATHDALDIAYRVEGSARGPSRTVAHFDGAPFAFRSAPPARSRPNLEAELRRPPKSVCELSRHDGARLQDLARAAMVTRSRDLDAFAYGDPRDARLIDDGDGLAFGLIGVVPDRRLFLPAVYGALTLRNGVPIGYVQLDVLFGNAEVSFNTFETFRGGEAGFVFCRLLAAAHHLFGAKTFSIEPYQLGRGNEEAILSGAWWFYARFGFRPRDPKIARLARHELGKRARDPAYRSSPETLARLATAHVYWKQKERQTAVISPHAGLGFALSRRLAKAAGADREAALDAFEERAGKRLGVRSTRGWPQAERLWWRRWSPLIDAIPGLDGWSGRERNAFVTIVRAKGARRESEYARLFDAHPRLAATVLAVARRSRGMR
jgi:hypothetical protein